MPDICPWCEEDTEDLTEPHHCVEMDEYDEEVEEMNEELEDIA
jgi:hypothetical protein